MSPSSLLLDTHALLWWLAGSRQLPKRVRAALDEADSVGLSAISVWEVGMLVAKGRVELDRDLGTWSNDLAAMPGVEIVTIDHEVASRAARLDDFHGDPADRLIAATAITRRATLVTKDDRVTAWARRSGLLVTRW